MKISTISLVFSIAVLGLIGFSSISVFATNHDDVLPFDRSVVTTSSRTSTILSFDSATIISTSSTTTTIGTPVTFDFYETNDGDVPLTSPSVSSSSSLCEPVFVSGDTNVNGILDSGEQWHYTCDVVSDTPSIFDIILTGFGIAPDDTIITWPDDPEERIIATVEIINPAILDSKVTQMSMVIDTLTGLKESTDDKTDKKIDKIIKKINKAINSKYWDESGNELTSKKGKKVFDETKKAVKDLLKISKKSDGIYPEITTAIDVLVGISEQLATDANSDAQVFAGDKKADKEIKKSNKELDKAQNELDKGKPDKAIDKYKKAWEHAQKAMKENKSKDHKHDKEDKPKKKKKSKV